MVDTKNFVETMINTYKIDEVCGVPCSTMTSLIKELCNRKMYTPFTNEGDAVAYAAGNSVAGRKVAVILQNSGLTNALSPISSLTSLYNIPMIYFVGYRGNPSGKKDEPQHKIVGKFTKELIKNATAGSCAICSIDEFINDCPRSSQIFVLVNKGDFSIVEETETKKMQSRKLRSGMSRYDIIKCVKDLVSRRNDTSVITTTGYTSREMMSLGEDDSRNFYCFGSMGCAYPFALGLAEACPDRNFIVIDGDGSCAMRFENSFLGHYPENLFRIVVNNDLHQSTGGQEFDFSDFENALLFTNYYSTRNINTLESHLISFLDHDSRRRKCRGIIGIVNSDIHPDLPRPQLKPHEILSNFQGGLNS